MIRRKNFNSELEVMLASQQNKYKAVKTLHMLVNPTTKKISFIVKFEGNRVYTGDDIDKAIHYYNIIRTEPISDEQN